MKSLRRSALRLGQVAFERRWLRGAFGVRWVQIETRGRRSGRAHAVVLDVIGEDRATGALYVQPANGREADWLRNLLHDPRVTLDRGGGARPALAREADAATAARVLDTWLDGHPRYARFVARRLGWRGPGEAATWLAAHAPVVSITPRS